MDNGTLLEVKSLTKEFPGVRALDNVNFDLREGEVHALCGENGAGKSTLIKCLCGFYSEYDGDIVIDGTKIKFKSIKDAEDKGIACIQQELALVPELSVGENVFLSNQPSRAGIIDWNKVYSETANVIHSMEISTDPATGIDPMAIVKTLSVQKQQIVEILKAIAKNARILILDEPTASLTEDEVDSLMAMINKLREKKVTCVYISHKIDEVVRIADRVTILRDGKTIETRKIEEFPKQEIINSMVGRELTQLFPRVPHEKGALRLEIKNYSVENPNVPGKLLLDNINLEAYRGEILGISGLMGSGRTELFSSIYGVLDAESDGEVFIDGEKFQVKNPRKALDAGISIVTEDRKKFGLVLGMSVLENTTMSNLQKVSKFGVFNKNEEIIETNKYVEYFKTKTPSVNQKAGNLSGGNQQKVVLGKALMTNPKVLVMDEPTRGIDVGAKYEIYKIMNQLVEEGVAVIMISSDMEEILGMSDRIVVFNEGKVMGELYAEEATQKSIMTISAGGSINED